MLFAYQNRQFPPLPRHKELPVKKRTYHQYIETPQNYAR